MNRNLELAAGQALEQVTQLSNQLWAEPNVERLLHGFARLLRDEFSVPCLSLLKLERVEQKWHLRPADIRINELPPIGPDLNEELTAQIKLLDLGHQEFRDGRQLLSCPSGDLVLALLGDASEGSLMVWREPQEGCGDKIEFLVRQLQNSYLWFNRLDRTQALVYRDDLTGLYNHRYLEIALDSEMRRAQRFQTSFCVLFIDLDNFKPINDRYGHLTGSQVLHHVAKLLKECLREVDSIFRYGGDEFVALLIEANSTAGLMAAERIRKRIEQTRFDVEGGEGAQITASIGVAACPEHTLDKVQLLQMADQCMYKSKHEGKNRVTLLGRTTRKEYDEELSLPVDS